MTKNLLEISHFGQYLKMLASSAGYLTAKSFSDALVSYRPRRDGTKIIFERSVQRWMGDIPAPPKERIFKLICEFFEKEKIFVIDYNDRLHYRLMELWQEAHARVSYHRTVSRPDIFQAADVSSVNRDDLGVILSASNYSDIASIISQYPHDRNTTYIVSELIEIGLPFDRGELQDKLGRIILECGRSPTERKISAICANSLARATDWRPSTRMVQQLEAHFDAELSSDPLAAQTTLYPLAFSLAKMGNHEPTRRIVNLQLTDKNYGEFDFDVHCAYYGTDLNQILAICSHLKEKRRTGIMIVNDTSKILRLRDRTGGKIRATVIDLLRQSGAALLASGLQKHGRDILKLCDMP